jgi:SWIM zinc finger
MSISASTQRDQRALDLYRDHVDDIEAIGGDLYLVPSCSSSGSYLVDYARETCNCGDFIYRLHEGEDGNCKHLLAVGILRATRRRLHACNGGWVSMGVETAGGEIEEVLYPCRRCASTPARTHEKEHHIAAAGVPFVGAVRAAGGGRA